MEQVYCEFHETNTIISCYKDDRVCFTECGCILHWEEDTLTWTH